MLKRMDGDLGLCAQIKKQTGDNLSYYSMEENYPEIWEEKPEKVYSYLYWFKKFEREDEVREGILRRAIEKTKPKESYKKKKTKGKAKHKK